MSFIQNAQEVLTAEEFALLNSLNAKSTSFEATPEEEATRSALVIQVRKAVAERDKMDNLKILNGKVYSIEDMFNASGHSLKEYLSSFSIAELLEAAGITVDKVKEHIKNLDKQEKQNAEKTEYAIYKNGEVEIKLNDIDRIKKEEKAFIVKGGVAGLVVALTNKEWFVKPNNVEKGKYKGSITYPNLTKEAFRLDFNKEELIELLQLPTKQGEPFKPAAKPTAKAKH
ncbi:hypothetical protein LE191_07445 [Janthinobacterium sp. HSC-3S05]|uniref:hypothetical protein n=1 Tax=Janthinobacterium lividum TaxID=29581 RepID=UPI001CD9075D|nr:hypothetical protein [Janthinobacterium lividum]MCA1859947.1 hypothetical protein [Janthinobacterium lividum]